MKRLYLSFAMVLGLGFASVACGGEEDPGDSMDMGSRKPGAGGKERLDGGEDTGDDAGKNDAGRDAGALAGDGGMGAPDGGSEPAPDSTVLSPDAGPATSVFEGMWAVTMVVNARTTCKPSQVEPQILDAWTFARDVLTGDHLGPNPFERAPGTDVWNTGETTIAATADLELAGGELGGTFIFYRDTCNVFYDITGRRIE